MKKLILVIGIILLISVLSVVKAQNIAITDDNGYTAHSSAMLDIKSLTKGMLVPRLTTVQRNAIPSPATGLLVFDTNENVFYYYTGSAWSNLSVGQLWTKNGNYVYLSNTDNNVGIGVTTPENKLLVKADASTGIDESIFAVLNNSGDTVFAVYQEGVRIWVNNAGGAKANGSRGGFAVGGFNPAKAGLTNEYLRVTPDSVRIYIDDDYVSSKANGSRGGFAVGGFNPAKGTVTDNYLFVQDDSTRVYVTGDEGFAIDNIEVGNEGRYMDLTPNNYFIGHESGDSITTGLYNSYFGFQAGKSTKTADDNVFIGYQSGYFNNSGGHNVFLGKETGYSNTIGYGNCFMGYQAGLDNIGGYKNVFIGDLAGTNNIGGQENIFIGANSGLNNQEGRTNIFIGINSGQTNIDGNQNIFIGTYSGEDNLDGNFNTFIGTYSGRNNTSGAYNTFYGNWAGNFNTTGGINTFFGASSGYNNSSGSTNSFFGYGSGYGNISGINNTYIGAFSGDNSTGSGNVFIGRMAGYNETGSDKLYIENTNTANPLIYGDFASNEVEINGNLCYTGTFGACSDKRYKKNIQTIQDVLTKIQKINGVYFDWRLDEFPDRSFTDKHQIGMIAQDVEKYFPELVDQDRYGYKVVDYSKFSAVLLQAIKEQHKLIDELVIENSKLKENYSSLELEMEQSKKNNSDLNSRVEKVEELLNNTVKKIINIENL